MTWKPDIVPYPDLSVMLGGGGPVSAQAVAAAGPAPGGKLVVTEVKASDSDLGYLAEGVIVDDRYLVFIGGTYGQATVLVSSNGKDWVRRKGMSSGLRAVITHAGGLVEVGEYGLIARSDDLGVSWTKQATDTQECLFGITVHQGVPWVCGDEGYLARFVDGAWQKQDLELEDRISDLVSIGDKLYLLCYDGKVRVLRAGVITEIEPDGADGPLCAMCRTRSGALILVGDGGFAARSGDGDTFTKLELEDVDVDLEAVEQLADGSLIIVGDSGTILQSVDDGWTWKPIKTDHMDEDYTHLWCILPLGAGALIGADDGALWKLAPKGDTAWAERTHEFEGEVYEASEDGDEDEDDDDDDEDDDDSSASTASAGAISKAQLDRSVDELELSVRTANALQAAEIQYMGQLVPKTEAQLLTLGFGDKSVAELKEILAELGATFGTDVGGWTPPDGDSDDDDDDDSDDDDDDSDDDDEDDED